MNEKMYDAYRLRVSDYTCHDTLAPFAVLDIFQDIAGKHANTYGMSFEELLNQNMIWVLLRVKYKVVKSIPLYSKVNAVTWPKKKGLVDFDREFQILSEENEVMVNGISKWVVVNSQTRKIIPAKHIEYKASIPEDSLFDKFDKIKDFDITGLNRYDYNVEFCDLDHNGHVNNAKYAVMVLNALKLTKEEIIDEFEINFVHEVRGQKQISLFYYKEDNNYFIKAICEENTVFLCKLILK